MQGFEGASDEERQKQWLIGGGGPYGVGPSASTSTPPPMQQGPYGMDRASFFDAPEPPTPSIQGNVERSGGPYGFPEPPEYEPMIEPVAPTQPNYLRNRALLGQAINYFKGQAYEKKAEKYEGEGRAYNEAAGRNKVKQLNYQGQVDAATRRRQAKLDEESLADRVAERKRDEAYAANYGKDRTRTPYEDMREKYPDMSPDEIQRKLNPEKPDKPERPTEAEIKRKAMEDAGWTDSMIADAYAGRKPSGEPDFEPKVWDAAVKDTNKTDPQTGEVTSAPASAVQARYKEILQGIQPPKDFSDVVSGGGEESPEQVPVQVKKTLRMKDGSTWRKGKKGWEKKVKGGWAQAQR